MRKQLNEWLKLRFGQETVEFHYLKIKPVIIAEELLVDEDNSFSSSIVDYKVWCFNGKAFCICVYFNRTSDSVCFKVFDREWNLIEDAPNYTTSFQSGTVNISKPEKLDTLIKYAEILSAGYPQMRVDFYIIKNKIYFGEITMTSNGGYMRYFTPSFLFKMGQEARKGFNL